MRDAALPPCIPPGAVHLPTPFFFGCSEEREDGHREQLLSSRLKFSKTGFGAAQTVVQMLAEGWGRGRS